MGEQPVYSSPDRWPLLLASVSSAAPEPNAQQQPNPSGQPDTAPKGDNKDTQTGGREQGKSDANQKEPGGPKGGTNGQPRPDGKRARSNHSRNQNRRSYHHCNPHSRH